MANQDQLEILKQGVEVWNKWREENLDVEIDLFKAVLASVNLKSINLAWANLSGADLSNADLTLATLRNASLHKANLVGINLAGAELSSGDFVGANLEGTDLRVANLTGANLMKANLSHSILGNTILGNNDLSASLGLETIDHNTPSMLGIDTLRQSKGKLPIEFLRGCALVTSTSNMLNSRPQDWTQSR